MATRTYYEVQGYYLNGPKAVTPNDNRVWKPWITGIRTKKQGLTQLDIGEKHCEPNGSAFSKVRLIKIIEQSEIIKGDK